MKLNQKGEAFIIVMAIIMLGTAALSTTKWNTGYEQAILIRGAEPIAPLYYSIAGIEDKTWWDLSTVQDRAYYLANKAGYMTYHDGERAWILGEGTWTLVGNMGTILSPGDHELVSIACNSKGNELYVGVDE